MKVIATKSFFSKVIKMSIGEVKEVDEATAKDLIRTGLAKEYVAKKEEKAPKTEVKEVKESKKPAKKKVKASED